MARQLGFASPRTYGVVIVRYFRTGGVERKVGVRLREESVIRDDVAEEFGGFVRLC